eukprot:SAG31_NODE_293_length_18292_cov_8.779586_7_plen_736_part_00
MLLDSLSARARDAASEPARGARQSTDHHCEGLLSDIAMATSEPGPATIAPGRAVCETEAPLEQLPNEVLLNWILANLDAHATLTLGQVLYCIVLYCIGWFIIIFNDMTLGQVSRRLRAVAFSPAAWRTARVQWHTGKDMHINELHTLADGRIEGLIIKKSALFSRCSPPVTDAVLEMLSRKRLESLVVPGCAKLTAERLALLPWGPSITELDLSGVPAVDDDLLQRIAASGPKNLKRLILGGSDGPFGDANGGGGDKMTAAGIVPLLHASGSALVYLDLSITAIDAACVGAIKQHCANLRELRLLPAPEGLPLAAVMGCCHPSTIDRLAVRLRDDLLTQAQRSCLLPYIEHVTSPTTDIIPITNVRRLSLDIPGATHEAHVKQICNSCPKLEVLELLGIHPNFEQRILVGGAQKLRLLRLATSTGSKPARNVDSRGWKLELRDLPQLEIDSAFNIGLAAPLGVQMLRNRTIFGDPVRALAGLVSLSIVRCKLPPVELNLGSSRRFPSLQILCIDSCYGATIVDGAHLPQLTRVVMSDSVGESATASVWQQSVEVLRLAHCPKLHHLLLTPSALSCLRELDLSFCKELPPLALSSPDGLFGRRASALALRLVKLSQCSQLTDNVLLALATSAPLLEELDVSYVGLLTDNAIRPFIWCSPNMRRLNCSNCRKLTVALLDPPKVGSSKQSTLGLQALNLAWCTKVAQTAVVAWLEHGYGPSCKVLLGRGVTLSASTDT